MAEAGPAVETVLEGAGPIAGPVELIAEGLVLACGDN